MIHYKKFGRDIYFEYRKLKYVLIAAHVELTQHVLGKLIFCM